MASNRPLARTAHGAKRDPAEQAADARRAFDALQARHPAAMAAAAHGRRLEVLVARMSNSTASLAELASQMSPPMTRSAFAGQLRRAHTMSETQALRPPLRLRSPAEQAADARRAFDALQAGQPAGLADTVYRRYIEVLTARMSNNAASLAELASQMSPPMTKDAFAAHLRRAHSVAERVILRAERKAHGDMQAAGRVSLASPESRIT